MYNPLLGFCIFDFDQTKLLITYEGKTLSCLLMSILCAEMI